MSLFDNVKRNRADTDDEDLFPCSNSKRRRHDDPNGGWGHRQSRILANDDYKVGWICALYIEMAAAQAMLDYVHDIPLNDPIDSNAYTPGSIGRHNIVVACLPADGYGTKQRRDCGRPYAPELSFPPCAPNGRHWWWSSWKS
jgi:hypothetical protein